MVLEYSAFACPANERHLIGLCVPGCPVPAAAAARDAPGSDSPRAPAAGQGSSGVPAAGRTGSGAPGASPEARSQGGSQARWARVWLSGTPVQWLQALCIVWSLLTQACLKRIQASLWRCKGSVHSTYHSRVGWTLSTVVLHYYWTYCFKSTTSPYARYSITNTANGMTPGSQTLTVAACRAERWRGIGHAADWQLPRVAGGAGARPGGGRLSGAARAASARAPAGGAALRAVGEPSWRANFRVAERRMSANSVVECCPKHDLTR